MELELFNLLTEMEFSDRARGLSDKTIKKNTKFLTMFFKYLSQEFEVNILKQVTANMIKSFMIYKRGQGNAESYVNVFLRSIRAFFIFCEEEEYISQVENPCLRVKWMKEEKKILTTFSEEDVKKMLVYTDKMTHKKLKRYDKYHTGHLTRFTRERDKFLVMLLADSGLRISEVHELTDATLTQEGINIIRAKGKKGRFIFTSPIILKEKMKYDRIKKEYFDHKNIVEEDYVFLTKIGKKYTNDMAQRDIKRIAQNAGVATNVRASPHTFRHFFTQSLLKNGADIYTIQRLLGHASIKTTEIYLNSLVDNVVLEKGLVSSPLMNL